MGEWGQDLLSGGPVGIVRLTGSVGAKPVNAAQPAELQQRTGSDGAGTAGAALQCIIRERRPLLNETGRELRAAV